MWRGQHHKSDIELKVGTHTVELAMAFANFKVDVFAVVAVVVFDLKQAFIPLWDRQSFSQALQEFLAPCHLFMEIVFFKVTVIFEVMLVLAILREASYLFSLMAMNLSGLEK